MNSINTDKDKILELKDGECYVVPESDYGLAEIWLKNGTYFLFSIPMFGGDPQFEKSFGKNNIDDLIKEYESWA